MNKFQKIPTLIVLLLFCIFSFQKSYSDEKNIEKCYSFSKMGLHEPAIGHCLKLLSSESNDQKKSYSLYYLSNSYFSLGDNLSAIKYIDELVKLNTTITKETFYLAGLIHLKLGDYVQASFYLQKAIESGLDGIDVQRLYARSLFKSGQADLSNLILTGLMYKNSDDKISMTQLTENLIILEDYSKAEGIINKIIKIDPEYSYSYYLKYQLSRYENDYKNALVNINKALLRDRSNIRYIIEKVKLLTQDKKYELAKYNISNIKKFDPNNIQSSLLLDNILDIQALDLQEKARNFIKSKDYDKSINHYNNAIKYNPSNSLFYFERGQVYLILENYEKSADDLIIAVSLNEDLEKNNLNLLLGKIFFKQGNIKLSLEYMDKELKVNPSSNEALIWQVRSLSEIGQYEEASIYADKLIKYNPDSPDGYAILGDIKLMLGNINESNLLHEKALSIDPEYDIATKTKVF